MLCAPDAKPETLASCQTDAKHPTHTSDQGAATLILPAQTRAAAAGSQWSCFTCVSQRFFRLGLLEKRTIRVPRLQWFVHCGTEYPGMSAPHAPLATRLLRCERLRKAQRYQPENKHGVTTFEAGHAGGLGTKLVRLLLVAMETDAGNTGRRRAAASAVS